jgi:putative endonuclease
MFERTYYVYIVACNSRRLYIGVTNNLVRRIWEHKRKLVKGFTARYNLDQLVYYESTSDVRVAIEREKQLKNWPRRRKLALVESVNPAWRDLSDEWTTEADAERDSVPREELKTRGTE